MKIVSESELFEYDWDSFVNRHTNGNIFQCYDFFNANKGISGYTPFAFGVVDNTKLLGIVSGVILSNGGKLGRYLTSRAIIIGGPLLAANLNNREFVLNFLLCGLRANLRYKVIYTQFRNISNIESDKQIFLNNEFKFIDHLDILIDLTLSEVALWNKMTRDRKKSITKGQREIEVFQINDYEKFSDQIYELLKTVYHRVKLPLPSKDYFNQVIATLIPKGQIKILGAFKNDLLIGVRLVLCFNKLIYDWYAGADDNYLEYRPNDILIWEVLTWGKKNGYNTFDFGGAGKPNVPYGVRDYKLKFGGELINFGRFEYIHKPCLYKFGKIGLKFYKLINDIRK